MMEMIEKIEIQYFRSIYRVTISDLGNINIFTGKNDAGKSNVLKALNLFFNNIVTTENDFNFAQNYNLKRREEVKKDTIKGKQFIQIKITFKRGKQYEKTLPEIFTVSKKWNRDSLTPQVTDNVEMLLKKKQLSYNDRSKASLTRYLNGIKYIYVPAIKDESIFEAMIKRLQSTVYTRRLSGDSLINDTMLTLYQNVIRTTQDLSNEFKSATNIDSMIATPNEVDELYKTLKIITMVENEIVGLEDRGDGIRVRYIPSILNYIALNASEKYVWGFEEPENSLEFNMARKMADDFYNIYRKNSLIFVTTHSPAFIDIGYKNEGKGYRCYREENITKVVDYNHANKLAPLQEELGYAYILEQQYNEFKQLTKENEEIRMKVEKLETELKISQKPVLLTEGKTDEKILKVAWEKLFDYECPFDIKNCNLLDKNVEENAIAGASVLRKILCSTAYDSPKILIGLFDNDKAGNNEFKLDANYTFQEGKKWKIHKNRKGYAFVIPFNHELKKLADIENLSIEFLFSKNSLLKEVEGKKLVLEKPQKIVLINGITVETDVADDLYWYYSKIKDSTKTEFAYNVVPTFEKTEFENFRLIFEIVLEILETID